MQKYCAILLMVMSNISLNSMDVPNTTPASAHRPTTSTPVYAAFPRLIRTVPQETPETSEHPAQLPPKRYFCRAQRKPVTSTTKPQGITKNTQPHSNQSKSS